MKNERCSVIIPTYNRPESLMLTLNTLFSQTIRPIEIIIVDDSTDDRTANIIPLIKKKSRGINIVYIKKNPKQRGTTFSRNIGIDKSKGEYLFFLDDDITVVKDYVESSLKFFKTHEDAVGIQWYAYSDHDERYDTGKLKNFFMKLFLLGYFEKDTCKVLPSMATVVPYPLTQDIKTEYMGSGTTVIKKKFLKNIRFDEKLTGYALQEDLDFSYRLHKKHGGLYIMKDRKVHHAYSLTARMNLRKILYTRYIYLAYIFKKNVPQTLLNKFFFWWSAFGRLILRIPKIIFRPSKFNFEDTLYTYEAIFSLIWHFHSLEKNPNYFKEFM